MNYWLHRISHEADVSRPLLEMGYLSIGFKDVALCPGVIEKATSDDWGYFEKAIVDAYSSKIRTRHSLWRFIAEMREGDWVIVPGWQTFSIYEITSGVQLASEAKFDGPLISWGEQKNIVQIPSEGLAVEGKEMDPLDIGFLRRVKALHKDIPRSGFADAALTSRMKVRNTNVNINDLEKSIKEAVEGFEENKPIDLKEILIRSSIDIWQKSICEKLTPDKFELLVEKYFKTVGATSTECNPNKNASDKSGDVDIRASFEPIKVIINVQVKHHKENSVTSEWAVEQICDFAESKNAADDDSGYVNAYWVVASSDGFSEEAKRMAELKGVFLFNGKEFARMLMEAGIERIDN